MINYKTRERKNVSVQNKDNSYSKLHYKTKKQRFFYYLILSRGITLRTFHSPRSKTLLGPLSSTSRKFYPFLRVKFRNEYVCKNYVFLYPKKTPVIRYFDQSQSESSTNHRGFSRVLTLRGDKPVLLLREVGVAFLLGGGWSGRVEKKKRGLGKGSHW
jgi:hypothetical protein